MTTTSGPTLDPANQGYITKLRAAIAATPCPHCAGTPRCKHCRDAGHASIRYFASTVLKRDPRTVLRYLQAKLQVPLAIRAFLDTLQKTAPCACPSLSYIRHHAPNDQTPEPAD